MSELSRAKCRIEKKEKRRRVGSSSSKSGMDWSGLAKPECLENQTVYHCGVVHRDM